MNFLSINKVHKVIDLAELVYCSMEIRRVNISETFVDKLSNYLEDFKMTGRTSLNVLRKYIDEFSEEEKAELIAIIWFGRGTSCEQAEDLDNLIAQALKLIPQNYATSYIIERASLAKYLRSGLQKINILPVAKF
ncbi:DUF3775 domain-containing protein [Nostoc sp. MG11]|uniref:DUF3775 domain-containing protein n=1 Tax=Nostoc sp. MG11 TaxID=2721166 RepID=UPI0018692B23|nr:DUF3775 domain-containing protein [Nostoc sp. MG11]